MAGHLRRTDSAAGPAGTLTASGMAPDMTSEWHNLKTRRSSRRHAGRARLVLVNPSQHPANAQVPGNPPPSMASSLGFI
jgi:hypothetical protein